MEIDNILEISENVKEAINEKKPIIALESTIISHGMPYPTNIELAKCLEKMVYDAGMVPATIFLMNGKIKIGINEKELELLGNNKNVKKVSRRDISYVLFKKEIGATTVAATMIAANMAGIKIFATGGIGGVHRFAETTFDISADLLELAQTPVMVISAGAKAILDLDKTLEYLETLGVPVYGYKSDLFPAFYSSESKLKIDRIDTPEEAAEIYKKNVALGFKSGILIANPIPKEHEIPYEIMEKNIDIALKKALENNIKGKNVTPFLLSELVSITEGKSLEANTLLVKNNVKLAIEIAKYLY